jgi:serine acetyltransferase
MIRIAPTAVIVDESRTRIADGVTVGHYCVIGQPNPYEGVFDVEHERVVTIGRDTSVGTYSLLFEGATLQERVQLETRSFVGSRSIVGAASRLLYGAQVHDHVTIGEESFVAGFVADHCKIGNRCHVFGSLIHRFSKPQKNQWDTTDEQGPCIADDVIVGWGAILIGPVTIGNAARIRPGAIVRRDVADGETFG